MSSPGWSRGSRRVTIIAILSWTLGVLLALVAGACTELVPNTAPASPTVIPGYFSAGGLPPVMGGLTLTDSGLEFRSAGGATLLNHRKLRGTRPAPGLNYPASKAGLAYTTRVGRRTAYVFRIVDDVFETSTPGPLLPLLAQPVWLDDPSDGEAHSRPAHSADTAAMWEAIRRIAQSSYADSLCALFGRPRAVGLVGVQGAAAGNLAEYIHTRDSLALDPARMASQAQLRHAFAHELGHRWEFRAPGQVDSIFWGVGRISDRKRYGYGSVSEQRAEAIAFAVHFLQRTAASTVPAKDALELLGHYDFLVPGTRSIVRYLVLQPTYRQHPLRAVIIQRR